MVRNCLIWFTLLVSLKLVVVPVLWKVKEKHVWTCLKWFELVWTGLNWFKLVWTCLFWFEMVKTSQNLFLLIWNILNGYTLPAPTEACSHTSSKQGECKTGLNLFEMVWSGLNLSKLLMVENVQSFNEYWIFKFWCLQSYFNIVSSNTFWVSFAKGKQRKYFEYWKNVNKEESPIFNTVSKFQKHFSLKVSPTKRAKNALLSFNVSSSNFWSTYYYL